MDSRSARHGATIHGSSEAVASGGARESRQDFCASLRTARERASLSIEEITRVTRIPEHQLRRLESGEFEGLPGDVFVRGFLRSYARCVQLDPDDVVARYAACGGLAPAPVASEQAREAAAQARALAHHDDGEVVRARAGLGRGTRPSEDERARAAAADAAESGVRSKPIAGAPSQPVGREPPRPSAAPTPSVTTTPSAAATPSVPETSSVTDPRPTEDAGPAGADRVPFARRTAEVRGDELPRPGAPRAEGDARPGKKRGSKKGRHGRDVRRRGPTVVPPPASLAPGKGRAAEDRAAPAPSRSAAAAPASRPKPVATAAPPRASEPRRRWENVRRGPVILAIAVLALVVAAILVMSQLLGSPGRGEPAGGAPAGSRPR